MDYAMNCILAGEIINPESCNKAELKVCGRKIFDTQNIITRKCFSDLYHSYNGKIHSHWSDYYDISVTTLLLSSKKYIKSIEFVLKNWEFFDNSINNLLDKLLIELVYFSDWIPFKKYDELINNLLPIFKPYHYEIINFLNDINEFFGVNQYFVMKLLEEHNYNKEFKITPEFLYSINTDKDAFIYYYTKYKDEVSEPEFVSQFCLTRCMTYHNIKLGQYIAENCQGTYVEKDFIEIIKFGNNYKEIVSFDIFKKFYPISENLLARILSNDPHRKNYYDGNIIMMVKLIEASDKIAPFDLKKFFEEYNHWSDKIIVGSLDLLLIKYPINIRKQPHLAGMYYGEYAAFKSENLFRTNNKIDSWKVNFMIHLNIQRNCIFS